MDQGQKFLVGGAVGATVCRKGGLIGTVFGAAAGAALATSPAIGGGNWEQQGQCYTKVKGPNKFGLRWFTCLSCQRDLCVVCLPLHEAARHQVNATPRMCNGTCIGPPAAPAGNVNTVPAPANNRASAQPPASIAPAQPTPTRNPTQNSPKINPKQERAVESLIRSMVADGYRRLLPPGGIRPPGMPADLVMPELMRDEVTQFLEKMTAPYVLSDYEKWCLVDLNDIAYDVFAEQDTHSKIVWEQRLNGADPIRSPVHSAKVYWSTKDNVIFAAVEKSTGMLRLFVGGRGTVEKEIRDWHQNLTGGIFSDRANRVYNALVTDVLPQIQRDYGSAPSGVTLFGHSLGGAIAHKVGLKILKAGTIRDMNGYLLNSLGPTFLLSAVIPSVSQYRIVGDYGDGLGTWVGSPVAIPLLISSDPSSLHGRDALRQELQRVSEGRGVTRRDLESFRQRMRQYYEDCAVYQGYFQDY